MDYRSGGRSESDCFGRLRLSVLNGTAFAGINCEAYAKIGSLHRPLFDLLEKMRKSGEATAERMYGCRGMMCHHNTDFYGDCAPQDAYPAATIWQCGGAWLGLHIWEHYLFTLDKEFLREKYPIMDNLALLFVDFLIEDKEGYLVTCPSTSPENRFVTEDGEDAAVCAGPTMDNQIIRSLMKACIEGAEILGLAFSLACGTKRKIYGSGIRRPGNSDGFEGSLLQKSAECRLDLSDRRKYGNAGGDGGVPAAKPYSGSFSAGPAAVMEEGKRKGIKGKRRFGSFSGLGERRTDSGKCSFRLRQRYGVHRRTSGDNL